MKKFIQKYLKICQSRTRYLSFITNQSGISFYQNSVMIKTVKHTNRLKTIHDT